MIDNSIRSALAAAHPQLMRGSAERGDRVEGLASDAETQAAAGSPAEEPCRPSDGERPKPPTVGIGTGADGERRSARLGLAQRR